MKNKLFTLLILVVISCSTAPSNTASQNKTKRKSPDTLSVQVHIRSELTPIVGHSLSEHYKYQNRQHKASPFLSKAVKTIHYKETIGGYTVTAQAFPKNEISCAARITFQRPNQSFTVECRDYFDWALFEHTNESSWYSTKQTMTLTYDRPDTPYRPFFFRDVDFDGAEELIVSGYDQAPRGCSLWQIYKIEQNKAFAMHHEPFNAMSDLTQFNNAKQLIYIYDDGGQYYTVERWKKELKNTFILEFQIDRGDHPNIEVFALSEIDFKEMFSVDTTTTIVNYRSVH